MAARFAAHRDAVNERRTSLLDVCRQEDLVLAADTVHYVSHWITPELAPRRYDTRFFITVAPPGQVARHDDGETIATIWVRPADALARSRGRRDRDAAPDHRQPQEHPVVPVDRRGDGLGRPGHRRRHRPAHRAVRGRDVLILRPGDEGYEEALADRSDPDPAVDAELTEAARDIWGPKAGTA